MATDAVQVRGIEGVIERYKAIGIAPWASCKGKAMNAKYEGNDLVEGAEILQQYLESLQRFNSAASYELRLYEDLGSAKKIRPSTPDYLSFIYSVKESGSDHVIGPQFNGAMSLFKELYEERFTNFQLQFTLEKMREEIDELRDELAKEPEPTQPDNKGIGALLLEASAPKLAEIGGAIGDRIIELILPTKPKALAGIVLENGSIDDDKVIYEAVTRLKKSVTCQPGLPVILTKLADMAEKRPFNFNTYAGILLKMKL